MGCMWLASIQCIETLLCLLKNGNKVELFNQAVMGKRLLYAGLGVSTGLMTDLGAAAAEVDTDFRAAPQRLVVNATVHKGLMCDFQQLPHLGVHFLCIDTTDAAQHSSMTCLLMQCRACSIS